MEPVTAFVIATLMMLLNGGVLGLVHAELPAALQPSARSWRIGTLLVAGGCILLAVQRFLPAAFVLPVANGMLMLGLAGYWHSLRQFHGLPRQAALLVPVVLATFGVWLFAGPLPDLRMRVAIVSVAWAVLMGGAILTLLRAPDGDRAVSRRVLAAIFVASLVFMMVRAVVFARPGEAAASILDGTHWINLVTPIVVSILPVIGTTAFLLMCSDRIRRQWEHAASTDGLTGLANRGVASREGQQLMRQGEFSVALIDVDHFKQFNDRYGHDTGDAALRHVAGCLREACPAGALAARHGGEEFVALLPAAAAREGEAIAERIRRAIETAPFASAGGLGMPLTVSIGVATRQAGDHHFDDLLRRADRGLYAAKNGGRNRVAAAE